MTWVWEFIIFGSLKISWRQIGLIITIAFFIVVVYLC